jgi:hypothetical protein
MTEIHFLVEEAPEGGFTARAVGADIFTEADDLPSLRGQVRDTVRCHFDEGSKPSVVRLHFARDEALPAFEQTQETLAIGDQEVEAGKAKPAADVVMRLLMLSAEPVKGVDIKALINEGRA